MEMWAWLAAYVLGFVMLQVYLYRYFVNGDSTAESATPDSTGEVPSGSGEPTAGGSEQPERGESQQLRCGNCGAHNDNHQMYLFCSECGNKLH